MGCQWVNPITGHKKDDDDVKNTRRYKKQRHVQDLFTKCRCRTKVCTRLNETDNANCRYSSKYRSRVRLNTGFVETPVRFDGLRGKASSSWKRHNNECVYFAKLDGETTNFLV